MPLSSRWVAASVLSETFYVLWGPPGRYDEAGNLGRYYLTSLQVWLPCPLQPPSVGRPCIVCYAHVASSVPPPSRAAPLLIAAASLGPCATRGTPLQFGQLDKFTVLWMTGGIGVALRILAGLVFVVRERRSQQLKERNSEQAADLLRDRATAIL